MVVFIHHDCMNLPAVPTKEPHLVYIPKTDPARQRQILFPLSGEEVGNL